MRTKGFLPGLTLCVCLLGNPSADAWDAQGHRLIGQAAYGLLDAPTAAQVAQLLDTSAQGVGPALDRACNWPDEIRDQAEWEWTAPLHYVNIPRSERLYDRQRDCPRGHCVTEGILRYAAELAKPGLGPEPRWQALAFLCHFVGDLHQPLHAGFRDDRGGNYVDVEYRGETWNLHEFWDGVLIRERLGTEAQALAAIIDRGHHASHQAWRPEDVAQWTAESHALALSAAYPASHVIDEAFADRSVVIARQQWQKAAERLALVLETVLAAEETATTP